MTAKSKCPKCGSENVTEIIYGLFDGNRETMERIKKGEVKLGGSCVREGASPLARCRNCGYAWGDKAKENQENSLENC